jgi:hypothetical protein
MLVTYHGPFSDRVVVEMVKSFRTTLVLSIVLNAAAVTERPSAASFGWCAHISSDPL